MVRSRSFWRKGHSRRAALVASCSDSRHKPRMNLEDIVIRRMSKSELDRALDWAAAEGWNPGLHDAESFYAVDPQGILYRRTRGRASGLHFRRRL